MATTSGRKKGAPAQEKEPRALEPVVVQDELALFERSGHSPFIEEPERFANEVASFLNEMDGVPDLGVQVSRTEDN
jgi:pimeloyl-ACP methyl ester carboxylesterase